MYKNMDLSAQLATIIPIFFFLRKRKKYENKSEYNCFTVYFKYNIYFVDRTEELFRIEYLINKLQTFFEISINTFTGFRLSKMCTLFGFALHALQSESEC